MNASQVYVLIAILALACIAAAWFFFVRPNGPTPLSPLSGVAFAFVIAGIVFGENRWVGYGLMGIGVALAILDAVRLRRR
jgi:drug/metabolite transporter (DMT)-like permease